MFLPDLMVIKIPFILKKKISIPTTKAQVLKFIILSAENAAKVIKIIAAKQDYNGWLVHRCFIILVSLDFS